MNRKVKITLGVIGTLIIVALLMHLTKNWLVPMIVKMHHGGGY